MRPYRYAHVVTLAETNVVGNVYFAHYAHWQGHAREIFLADHAPHVLAAVTSGELALVTVSCRVDYLAECFALDRIDIAMTLAASGGNRISMRFDYCRDGTQVATGEQTVACMRRCPQSGLVPTTIPPDLAQALAQFA